ncbi:MAG: DUF4375 domain-containing protein [Flavobacteriales bacterium]|nr:DUF4375 domain-containing protein [Flavobacteriales bacterium]
MIQRENFWSIKDSENQIRPVFKKKKYHKLKSWKFGWELLEPLNKASNDNSEIELSKKFSDGQKALYFWWYLDAQVTNGGFIQFYSNGFDKYLPAIISGLETINDNDLIILLKRADTLYENNLRRFQEHLSNDDFGGLYESIPEFSDLDQQYYKIHNNTMNKLEVYAKENSTEFVELI